MSGVMEDYLRLQKLGLSNIPEKSICVKHVDELYIKKYISKNYESGFWT